MEITWYGTASLAITDGNTKLLIDPFLPCKHSPVTTTADDFTGEAAVLITHAHMDHVGSLPVLCSAQPRTIYGTQAVQQAMERLQAPWVKVRPIQPGQSFTVGRMRITAYQSSHIKFDGALLRRTFINRRAIRYFGSLVSLLHQHIRCKEQGEIVGYLIECDGKQVFILGSLHLHPATVYPTHMDMLVLPYQGNSKLLQHALPIIEQLQPCSILLDHFDNTFPPLSNQIDTTDIVQALRDRVPLIVPDYRTPYVI